METEANLNKARHPFSNEVSLNVGADFQLISSEDARKPINQSIKFISLFFAQFFLHLLDNKNKLREYWLPRITDKLIMIGSQFKRTKNVHHYMQFYCGRQKEPAILFSTLLLQTHAPQLYSLVLTRFCRNLESSTTNAWNAKNAIFSRASRVTFGPCIT